MRLARPLALIALLLAACSGSASMAGPTSSTPTTAATTTITELPPTTAPVPAPRAPVELASPATDGRLVAVDRVIDGDTIVVAGGERVRLIGIDTPETVDPRRPVQCFGREASEQMQALLPPAIEVELVSDVEGTDRFGRTLAYVYRASDGLFVNAALVADGYALTATYPPNVAHVEELAALAREAREAGRGLWSACGDDAPPPEPEPVVAPQPLTGGGECDPSYPDHCIPPSPPDLDCGSIQHRRFRVLPPDPHRFDGNHDAVGCES